MTYFEAVFIGIPGPYHNYGGLAFGNVASSKNKNTKSEPQKAALQALEMAKQIAAMGVEVAMLPPQPRPDFNYLRNLGYNGSEEDVLSTCREKPKDLTTAYSSAAMWTANAATVAPSSDSADNNLNLIVANLSTNQHRAIEARQTYKVLSHIFGNGVLPALPNDLSDEGAANHMRLKGDKIYHVFVYGTDGKAGPKNYPARQTLAASKEVAERLKINTEVLFLQQNPDVIDAGVFHNDVIAVSNENVLLYHEHAFVVSIEKLKGVIPIRILEKDLSVADAVRTYFFNSQIISLANGKMVIIAPYEVANHKNAKILMDKIASDSANPIQAVHYFDLKQSMQNGGGPACLRLRVQMNHVEKQRIEQNCNVFLTNEVYEKLKAWIIKHYRQELQPEDLFDIKLYRETQAALLELEKIIRVPING